MTEKRVVNERTGGEKGSKLARFDLIPPRAITALAEHFGKGAEKYAARNWERGVDWSLAFAAMQRHVWAWWNGEDNDVETGSSHLAAAMWHCAALLEYAATHPELDDRPDSPHTQVVPPKYDHNPLPTKPFTYNEWVAEDRKAPAGFVKHNLNKNYRPEGTSNA